MKEEDVASWDTEAYITKQYYRSVEGMNLVWASNNRKTINIPTKQSEMLNVARLQTKIIPSVVQTRGESFLVLNIPSEDGFGKEELQHRAFGQEEPTNKKSRVYLLSNRKYSGTLEVGADDIPPITTNFELFEKDGLPYMQLGS